MAKVSCLDIYSDHVDITRIPLEQRAHIQGQALYVRSARLTARTLIVRAVLRHDLPNKGLVSPVGSVSASKCFAF